MASHLVFVLATMEGNAVVTGLYSVTMEQCRANLELGLSMPDELVYWSVENFNSQSLFVGEVVSHSAMG